MTVFRLVGAEATLPNGPSRPMVVGIMGSWALRGPMIPREPVATPLVLNAYLCIVMFVLTKCVFLDFSMPKMRLRPGLRPDSVRGACTALPTPPS